MREYRVSVETLQECYEYVVVAACWEDAEKGGEALAMNDGLDPHAHHYIRTELL